MTLVDEQTAVAPPPARPGKPVLAVENVSKTYPPVQVFGRIERALARLGGTEATNTVLEDEDDGLDEPEEMEVEASAAVALSEVTFTVAAGSVVGIVGPPGAGKTVLLNTIAGLSAPTEGRVVVRGRTAAALEALVRALPPRLTMERSLTLLATLLRLSPHVLRHRADEIFSFGEIESDRRSRIGSTTRKRRRLLLLGLALSAEVELVLIDVPFGGTRFREKCTQAVAGLRARGTAVLVTARDVDSVADFADRVVYLEQGRIVADAEPGHVAALLKRERGVEGRSGHPPLTHDAARYVEFLQVALGVSRADAAVGAAIDAAEAAGLEHVDWDAIANAAGLDRRDTQAVVDRLRARADGLLG